MKWVKVKVGEDEHGQPIISEIEVPDNDPRVAAQQQGAGPEPPKPGDPEPRKPEEPPPSPKEPFAVFPTSESFNERVRREMKSYLQKELGLAPDEVKKRLSEYDKLQKEQEEKRKQELSEIERAREEQQRAEQEAKRAQEERDQAVLEAHLSRLWAKHGIKNTEYAAFKITSAIESLPEGQDLDEEEWLKEQLNDPRERFALGVDTEAPAPPKPGEAPASTTAPPTGKEPKPPKAGGSPEAPKSAFDLPETEWRKRKAALGVP